MEIGDIVVLTKDHTFVFTHYKKGHKFRITGRKIFIDREIGKEVTFLIDHILIVLQMVDIILVPVNALKKRL